MFEANMLVAYKIKSCFASCLSQNHQLGFTMTMTDPNDVCKA